MWDVFISHASEDKDTLVRPLAKQLSDMYKVDVWYDEFTLEYGDSLLESIEKGLQDSEFGIVIFSNEFFKKTWTNHEYNSLRTKEMLLEKKVIIPVWYNITKKQVAKYSLTLADKFAISLNDNFDIDDLAIKITKIIRPDIYDNISRMRHFEQLIINSNKVKINNKDFCKIPIPPIRHEKISTLMKSRLKLIHNSIKDVDLRSFENYEEDFRRNTNIDRELVITELITAAYLDCISVREMTLEEKIIIYSLTLTLGDTKYDLYINPEELVIFLEIIESYIQNIDADIVVEYKFDNK